MSQQQRQEDSAVYGTRQPLPTIGNSPTAAPATPSPRTHSRGQTTQSPLNTILIPRDYLTLRSDVQPSRKAKPSPLQASYLPQSLQTAESSSMPLRSNSQPSRTMADQQHPPSEGGTESTRLLGVERLANGQTDSSPVVSRPADNGDLTKPSGQDGNGSYRGQLSQSPPESPVSTTSSMKSETAHTGLNMPRNSSIDSALSNVSSSTTHPTKTATSTNLATSAEIKNLIATAGSPENLITYLLNEKQHAASQNAQLWKLVEKQRSLLLGLNKDLEQLNKNKEKYKKKLKELQGQGPPVAKGAVADTRQSSAQGSDMRSESQTGTDSRLEYGWARGTPDKSFTAKPLSSAMDVAMLPPPVHAQQQPLPSNNAAGSLPDLHLSETSGPLDHTTQELRSTNTPTPDAAADAADRQEHRNPASAISSQELSKGAVGPSGLLPVLSVPSVTIIEPSPLSEKSEKSFSSTKRTKPAPLNLNQSKRGSMMILPSFQPKDQSSSKDDDMLAADEERGRRKTREEDDRNRALLAKQESEARSRSKRGKSAPASQQLSPVMETVLTVPKAPANGLPLSPRPNVPRPTLSESGDLQPPPYTGPPPNRLPPAYSTDPPAETGSEEGVETSPPYLAVPLKSPGLPTSPRPIDRPLGSPLPRMSKESAGVSSSLPLSPRMMLASTPLSPRAPRQPLPPHTPASFPGPAASTVGTSAMSEAGSVGQQPNAGSAPKDPKTAEMSMTSAEKAPQVFRGYVDLNCPNLLLPPNALPSVLVKVTSPRLRPSRMSYLNLKAQDEAPVFMLSVFSRFDGRELWRAEKVIMALVQLDHQFQAVGKTTARLPDRKLFSGHSPATVDARRTALDSYFSDLLDTPMNEKAALIICFFLSTDVIEPGSSSETTLAAGRPNGKPVLTIGPDGKPRKEGYLTKRGKNFGGWKERFFVLHGPDLRYFESSGGAHLGIIKLQNAQIGKQPSSDSPGQNGDDAENQYRHAFVILEPKRKDSTSLVKHVLCAESDAERDDWVAALLHYVDDLSEDEASTKGPTARTDTEKRRTTKIEAKVKQYASSMIGSAKEDAVSDSAGPDTLKSINYADAAPGATPSKRIAANDSPSPTSTSAATTTTTTTTTTTATTTPPQSAHNSENNDQPHPPVSSKTISHPTNGGFIQDAEAWGNKPAVASSSSSSLSFKENYHKKRGLWNFRQKSSTDLSAPDPFHGDGHAHSTPQTESMEPRMLVRAVFGLPLAEAVELCPVSDVDVNLPAVVHRCLEYLRAKNAAGEEGIFRLSGSNIVIKALKERFNTEGDVNLVAEGQYYDVHAVASLFKLYLRELPTTVLTRELHIEFLGVLDLENKKDKVVAFNGLVHRLPPANFSLLRALSEYLLEVVNNSEKNKMSVRNVGIVFSPTLNIPAPVFAQFLSDFDAVFDSSTTSDGQTRRVEVRMPNNLAPVDIRSPRHQMFSDLPTPAYGQTSFAKGSPAGTSTPQPTPGLQRAESPEDVGFTPMQPSYEARHNSSYPRGRVPGPQRHTMMPVPSSQAEYGSLNMMITPGNAPNLKAKRRESSMLFMG